jgi:hypothetical protein
MKMLMILPAIAMAATAVAQSPSAKGRYELVLLGSDTELALVFDTSTGCVAQVTLPKARPSDLPKEQRLPHGFFLDLQFSDWVCPKSSNGQKGDAQ